jgi:hypothetical protein
MSFGPRRVLSLPDRRLGMRCCCGMSKPDQDRVTAITAVETEAEVLIVHQLDLLAQLEAQLRAVHHTMRCIEKLRSAKHRVGPELTNGQRIETLTMLASELASVDQELQTQHRSCDDMQRSIREMQARLSALPRTVKIG